MYVVGAPHRSRGKSPAPGFSSCWTDPWDSGWAIRGCLNLSPRPRGVGVRPHHLLPRPCPGSEKPGLQLESPGEEGRGQPGRSWGPGAAGGYLATSRGTVRARLGGQEAGAEHLPPLGWVARKPGQSTCLLQAGWPGSRGRAPAFSRLGDQEAGAEHLPPLGWVTRKPGQSTCLL